MGPPHLFYCIRHQSFTHTVIISIFHLMMSSSLSGDVVLNHRNHEKTNIESKLLRIYQIRLESMNYRPKNGHFYQTVQSVDHLLCIYFNKTGLQPVSKTCGTNSWVLSKRFKCKKKCLKSYWRLSFIRCGALAAAKPLSTPLDTE